MRRTALLLALTLLLSNSSLAQDNQYTWRPLPPIDSFTTPTLSPHPDVSDGALYAAAIAYNGLVAVTSTAQPDSWAAWDIMGPEPCPPFVCGFYADPYTDPVFAVDQHVLYLFVRGSDNNLHVIRKVGTSAWDSNWMQLTHDGRIQGRFSVAITRSPSGAELHVLHTVEGLRVEVRHMALATWVQTAPSKVWLWALEGSLGSDGNGQLFAAVRHPFGFITLASQPWPWTSPWQTEGVVERFGDEGDFFDLSNVVHYAGAFHVAYSERYLCNDILPEYCHKLSHAAVPRGHRTILVRDVAQYTPGEGPQALSTLAVYRNKLVVAFTDVSGQVRYARLDNADPFWPWVGGDVVDTGDATIRRPGLGTLNRRPYLTTAAYGLPNFGDDLFVAIVEEFDQSVSYLNLSRAIFLQEAMEQFTFWDSNERPDPVCRGEPADATLITNPLTDGRPIYTEVGFNIWMLPDWLASHIFQDAGRRGCLAGHPSGRFLPPCDDTGYPVIIRPVDEIGICGGVWIGQMNAYLRVWDELGHTLSGMLGFHDDGTMPSAQDAEETGIPLWALNAGHGIFGESLGTGCVLGSDPNPPNAGRCRGFTGYAGNYDATTRQHSFMGMITVYIGNGDMLRDFIERDLSSGIDLLQRKYEWIREHIFRGVEFVANGEPKDPWNVDCRPDLYLTCGSSRSHNNNLGTDEVDGYPCNGFDYSGPEVAHVLRFPLDATVTVDLTGLAADLDLLLLTAAIDQCDSASCTASSTSGGSSSESLTFTATAGNTYYLMVDGYLGAQSAYTLSVSCETGPPGSVPRTGAPLMLSRNPNGVDIDLVWGVECGTSVDFALYRGLIGAWESHQAELCSTGGLPWATVPQHPDSYYFLVTAHNGVYEGGYGTDSSGAPRPPSAASCTGAWDYAVCP